jgi:hypothetical protein
MALLWTAATLTGCSDEGLYAPEAIKQPVVNGAPSPSDQNAVVIVRHRQGSWGTGSVVAPRLVLTSKQLLFEGVDGQERFECGPGAGAAISQVLDPADFTVMFGEKFPMSGTAGVRRIHASGALDFCDDDLVLLEIDAEFPVAPLPIRFLKPPSAGEDGLLVGWGMSDASKDSPPGASRSVTGMRYQIKLTIEALGPRDFPLPSGGTLRVAGNTFLTGEGGCYGDGGAPFLSLETGAIIGTLSFFEPGDLTSHLGDETNPAAECYHAFPAFRTLSAEREWLTQAFYRSGAAPWLEGSTQPARAGEACEVNEDCFSGSCVEARSGHFCSSRCDDGPCSVGQECVPVNGNNWCVPDRWSDTVGDSAACSMSAPSRPARQTLVFPLLVLLFAFRRGSRCAGRLLNPVLR